MGFKGIIMESRAISELDEQEKVLISYNYGVEIHVNNKPCVVRSYHLSGNYGLEWFEVIYMQDRSIERIYFSKPSVEFKL